MTERTTFDRRTVLRLLGWAGLTAVSGSILRGSDVAAGILPHTAYTPGDAIFRHRDSAIAVGAEFLRLRPSEAHTPTLLRSLGLPQFDLSRLPEDQREALLAQLSARHRDDFRLGRVFELRDWTLSATELRLSALAYLAE